MYENFHFLFFKFILCAIYTRIYSDELARLWSALETRGEVGQGAAILDYLDVDENLTTGLFFNLVICFF